MSITSNGDATTWNTFGATTYVDPDWVGLHEHGSRNSNVPLVAKPDDGGTVTRRSRALWSALVPLRGWV